MRQQADERQGGLRNLDFHPSMPQEAREGGLGGTTLPWLETVATGVKGGLAYESDSGESLAGLTHDARNMVASIELYCDLLSEPGVLSAPCRHYAGELRLVAGASRRLLERLALLAAVSGGILEDSAPESARPPGVLTFPSSVFAAMPVRSGQTREATDKRAGESLSAGIATAQPIGSVAQEVRANRNLLAALAGPGIELGMTICGGERPVAMAADDLTRVLINLVRNAVDAMPGGGKILIDLEERSELGVGLLSLAVADTGGGIPEAALESIFASGYSTHLGEAHGPDRACVGGEIRPRQRRGLGLAIVRSLVVAAGGTVRAGNRQKPPAAREVEGAAETGALFVIQFPIKT